MFGAAKHSYAERTATEVGIIFSKTQTQVPIRPVMKIGSRYTDSLGDAAIYLLGPFSEVSRVLLGFVPVSWA